MMFSYGLHHCQHTAAVSGCMNDPLILGKYLDFVKALSMALSH